MQTLSTGSFLQHGVYRIEAVLGQGGFGITYLATDVNLQRKVAIKEFFPKDFCERDETTSHVTLGTKNTAELVNRLKAKFLKEARNIAKLNHPGIIRIFAAFEENNTAYYVMEYIEGESLSAMVKRGGPLSFSRAMRYVEEAGKALEYVHARKINHLDVKPANIMVRRSDDTPILIDFGLSKQYDSEGNQTSTMAPGFSHGYAPMEQYNAGGVKEFSPQTDIYSLAATLYYLLSGVTPPQATRLNDEELTFPATIPTRMIGPISKAMSPGRRHRHPAVEEFIGDLKKGGMDNPDDNEATELGSSGSEGSGTKEESGGPVKPDHKNSRTGLFVIAGVAVLAIVGVVLWLTMAKSDTEKADETTNTVADMVWESQAETKSKETGIINGHEWVDLGLPSGLKWATCNVGASSPSDYGNFYAWGETATKSSYDKSNSLTYGKSISELRSAGIIGTSGTLTMSHDAARANWGGSWRMPTRKECEELKDKCTWTWTTQGGRNGYEVTGPNGRSIFLPTTGWRQGTSLYNPEITGGTWSSVMKEGSTDLAYHPSFSRSERSCGFCSRSDGFTVRPVSE